ncbi:MAG: glycosyltransferase family 39 protein [Solirubrobacteraceae bacterium]
MRLPSLGNSLFGDELSTYSLVNAHNIGHIVNTLDGRSVDLTPPLYFILAWLGTRLGASPEALRSPALLAGVATIPLTYLLGLRTIGRRGAIIGALLVALSPFLIFYATEARAYSVVTFFVLASTLALLEATRTRSANYWIAYACLSCAAIYTHYTAVFPLAAQAIWAVVTKHDELPRVLGANLAATAGFAPWLPALSNNSGSFGTKVFGIVDPFGPHAIVHDLTHWAIGHPYLPLSAEPGAAAIVLILAGLGLAAALRTRDALMAHRARPPGANRPDGGASAAILLALLTLAAPVGLALYSTLRDSAWDMRNLITAWPAYALGLGAVLAIPRRLGIAATGLVLLGFAIAAGQLLSSADQRPDYAAAAHSVLSQGAPADPVAIVPAPTPGPYAAMDAAFAYAGDPGRRLLRVGAPSLSAVLAAPPYAFLPATPTARLLADTLRARARKVFVIAPGLAAAVDLARQGGVVDVPKALGPTFGTGTSGALLGTVFKPLSDYVRAILPSYAPVRTIHLPGFLRLSVYVFQRR